MPLVSLLKPNKWHLSNDERLLKAGDFDRLSTAEKLIETTEAALTEERQKLDKERAQAREEGFQQGREEARVDLSKHLVELTQIQGGWVQELEGRLEDIVEMAVRKIIGKIDHGERIIQATRAALSDFAGTNRIKIKTHPDQLDEVNARLPDLTGELRGAVSITVECDASINPGDCLLESPLGSMDLSIEKQLDNLFDSLRAERADSGPSGQSVFPPQNAGADEVPLNERIAPESAMPNPALAPQEEAPPQVASPAPQTPAWGSEWDFEEDDFSDPYEHLVQSKGELQS